MWARVQAFSSNFVTLSGEEILEGTVVEGILTATYGKHMAATFGSILKSSVGEWRANGAGPSCVAEDLDLDPWSWSPLPALGGSGFANKKENIRITGVRVKPPPMEVYQYHLRNEDERKKKVSEPASSSRPKSPSNSRNAVRVYDTIRKAHDVETKERARHLRNLERMAKGAGNLATGNTFALSWKGMKHC